jgi:hypothetical protein
MITHTELCTLLAPYGELRAQGAEDWNGDILLPKTIADFYQHIGPWGSVYHANIGPVGSTIPVGGNPICIPPLHKLWSIQAGYRWHGNTYERLLDWRDSWLVIAQEGSNPFIFDTDSEKVLFDLAGGKWAPKEVSPDLFTAIAAFSTIANTRDAFFNEATIENDEESAPEYRMLLIENLSKFFETRQQALHFINIWNYDGQYE